MDGLTLDFLDYYKRLEQCCLADGEEFLEHIRKAHYFEESEGDGPCGAAVAELDDGKFVVFQEWQDYTGHG